MTTPGTPGRISRRERAARTVLGMPVGHPELLTRRPGRSEWRQLTAWLTEMWPGDEYTVIVAEAWRREPPPGARGHGTR